MMKPTTESDSSDAMELPSSNSPATSFERNLAMVNSETPWHVPINAPRKQTDQLRLGAHQSTFRLQFRVGKLPVPPLIGGRWKLSAILGEGSFGKVFSATDLESGEKVAVKIECIDDKGILTLKTEFEVYKRLKSLEGHIVGLPQCIYYGHITRNHRALVIEKLGKSLVDLKSECCGARMSLKTVITLGAQGVRRLEHLHHIGYVHRDIKPANMLVSEEDPSRMYLVDFGLAAKFLDKDGNHVPKKAYGAIGTMMYSSLNTHLGTLPTRRCDLESLGYSLVELARGDLPWNRARTDYQVYRMKAELPLSDMCSGLGQEFEEYFMYVRSLEYDQKPDYEYLRNLFKRAMKRHGYRQDRVMDWTAGNPRSKSASLSSTEEMM